MKHLRIFLCLLLLAATSLSAKTVEPVGVTKTTSGTVAAGARGVLFVFSSDFTGTINGVAWAGSADSYYQPPIQAGDTFAAIAYTVTAGTVRIIVTR